MRKAIGARRGELVRQFLVESSLIALSAGAASVVIAKLALPFFNEIMRVSLDMGPLLGLGPLAVFAGFLVITGLLGWVLYEHQLTGRFSAFEVAWFVTKSARGGRDALKLPLMAQQLAQEQGALDFYLSVRQDRLGAFLERMGYRAVDRNYVIALDGDARAESRHRRLEVGR